MTDSIPRRAARRARSLFSLTVRQRICLYLVLAALGGLACAGVDFAVDANRMDADVPAPTQPDCDVAAISHQCDGGILNGGICHLKGCVRPPSSPDRPTTNCPFGTTNKGRPWTTADCTAKALNARCTEGTLYSIGCYGYTCTDGRCGQ